MAPVWESWVGMGRTTPVSGVPQTLQGLCTVAWQTLEQYGMPG